MRKIYLILITFIISLLTYSCSPEPVNPPKDNTEEEKPDPDPLPDEGDEEDWSWENGYPKGVSVEEFEETFSDGKKCLGFIATIDFKANPNLTFNCLLSNKKKKPSVFFADFPNINRGVPCLATNAGYFAGATSVSMCIHEGRVLQKAWRSFNWPNDENPQCTIYPVRSAIGQMEDGSFEIQWAYCTDVSFARHTAFPSALDNNEKTQNFMSAPPTADYVEGAFTWEPAEAVGGGPRLVQAGKNVAVENYWAECLDAGGTSGLYRVNRTAAGITADGKLILIVADGRGSRGSVGYTLSELAEKFISLGCTDALNLDGGGSSCLVGADGKILNSPSDAAGERAVSTAIVIGELEH
ncbi:MAG: phosphodiester glycosidase family protein [Candidatus Cryptobacteroides sp.]